MNGLDRISGDVLDLSIPVHRELKSVEQLNAAHAMELLTYLRLTKSPLGLLINFGGATLKEGFRRLVNNCDDSAS